METICRKNWREYRDKFPEQTVDQKFASAAGVEVEENTIKWVSKC